MTRLEKLTAATVITVMVAYILAARHSSEAVAWLTCGVLGGLLTVSAIGGAQKRDDLRRRNAALNDRVAAKTAVIDMLTADVAFHKNQNQWLRREVGTLRETALPTLVGPLAQRRLVEQGRLLANRRDDLIAQGVDPQSLEVPLAPFSTDDDGGAA